MTNTIHRIYHATVSVKVFDTPKEGIGVLDQATTYRYAYESTSYTADLLLRYNNTFGKHDVGAFFGYEQYRAETTGFSAEKKV